MTTKTEKMPANKKVLRSFSILEPSDCFSLISTKNLLLLLSFFLNPIKETALSIYSSGIILKVVNLYIESKNKNENGEKSISIKIKNAII